MLEEAALTAGASVWDTRALAHRQVPGIVLSDGPHGVRRQLGSGDHLGIAVSEPATCFPTAVTTSNSWDPGLLEEMGRALGEEARRLGVDVILGPGINIKRNPRCGRNFEYYSEDPFHAGKMAAGLIRGIEESGVAACVKHFAVNSQETRRMASNSVVDEQTLREIYLTAFEIALREGRPRALMSAYNQVNGVYMHEHPHLIGQILRGEWGFDGIVVSDWGGSNDAVAAIRAGSTLEMPCPGWDSVRRVAAAVEDGSLDRAALTIQAERMIRLTRNLSAQRSPEPGSLDEDMVQRHHALARRVAEESAVLLVNREVNGTPALPIATGTRVAIVGAFADTPRIQGAGSSVVNATRIDSPLAAYREIFEVVESIPGYTVAGEGDEESLARIDEVVSSVDAVIIHIGLDEKTESEGIDRFDINLPAAQLQALARVCEAVEAIAGTGAAGEGSEPRRPRLIVVLHGGGVVDTAWIERVDAVLYTGLPGQAGAGAIADLVSGASAPSGRISETYPLSAGDIPGDAEYPAQERDGIYREGIFVGYRHYTTSSTPVRFPFGHGLTYTTFLYRDLEVTPTGVRLTVENTGEHDGSEVVQLYVGMPEGHANRPLRQLKGFSKVRIPAGGSCEVAIDFDEMTFRHFDTERGCWMVEGGQWLIEVGASCEDIRLSATLEVESATLTAPVSHAQTQPYSQHEDASGSEETIHANTAIGELVDAPSAVARLAARTVNRMEERKRQRGILDLNLLFLRAMPLRALAKMTNGMVTPDMVDAIVTVCRGHFFRGITDVARKFLRARRADRHTAKELGQ